jgi:hypothetical protein
MKHTCALIRCGAAGRSTSARESISDSLGSFRTLRYRSRLSNYAAQLTAGAVCLRTSGRSASYRHAAAASVVSRCRCALWLPLGGLGLVQVFDPRHLHKIVLDAAGTRVNAPYILAREVQVRTGSSAARCSICTESSHRSLLCSLCSKSGTVHPPASM